MGPEDRRHFKRYDDQSACEIRIGDDIYNGFVVDYGDGLGVIADKAYLLKKGAIADIRILNSSMEVRGRVVWAREKGMKVRAGIDRIGNLNGSMRDFKLSDVLIGIQRGTRTGTLEIRNGPVVKRVYIKNGDMVFADSSLENDRLGEMLVREGKITIEQFNLASERLRKGGEKLGKILVRMSCLTPRELYQAVRHQVEEIILSLFTISEGEFEFKEGSLPGNDLITLIISAANVIYLGMKRVQSFIDLKQMCPPMETVLVLSQDPMDVFQSVILEPEDKLILYLINRRYTLQKVMSLSPSSAYETLRTVVAFLKIGIVRTAKTDETPSGISVGDMLEERNDGDPGEYLSKVEELHSRCGSAEYYGFFGIDRKAADEEIQRAYFSIAKQFHPDRHFAFAGHDIKGKLINIFTYATEVYSILSNPEKREKYDRELHLSDEVEPDAKETSLLPQEDTAAVEMDTRHNAIDDGAEIMISDLQESVEQQPQEDPETHYELGIAYMEMGLEEDAVKEFRIASIDPAKRVICCKAIARYYLDNGEYQPAIEEYEKLVSGLSAADEQYLELKYELADSYAKNEEFDKAFNIYSEIQSLDAGYRDVPLKLDTLYRFML